MTTQPITRQVRWQDLKVKNEVDIILEIAQMEGWKDCEIFGYGDMIIQPQESKGWKLIPADLYKYSIPMEGVGRLHQIINAGVRIKGVIIADDERGKKTLHTPAKPKVLLPSIKTIVSSVMSFTGNAISFIMSLAGRVISSTVSFVGKAISFTGKALLRLILVAGAIGLIAVLIYWIKYLAPIIFLGLMVLTACTGSSMKYVEYDPKLVILVDDGRGGTVWVSVFTWYD